MFVAERGNWMTFQPLNKPVAPYQQLLLGQLNFTKFVLFLEPWSPLFSLQPHQIWPQYCSNVNIIHHCCMFSITLCIWKWCCHLVQLLARMPTFWEILPLKILRERYCGKLGKWKRKRLQHHTERFDIMIVLIGSLNNAIYYIRHHDSKSHNNTTL